MLETQPIDIICPICSVHGSGIVETHKDYKICHCTACDIVFAEPMRTEAEVYNSSEYYILRDNLVLDPLRWDFRWDMLEFLREPPFKEGNLLDIGCGTGFFVKRACEMGFNAYGIDFNENAIRKGMEYFHIETLKSLDIKSLGKDLPHLKFHLVTLFQVLEHLENPNQLMADIRDVITRDAVVVIALPLRERWPDILGDMDLPPHHLTRWSLKALRLFLERNGFYVRRYRVEPFPLQNVQALIYPYVLKLLPRLTLRGQNIDLASEKISREQAETMLKKMKAKKDFANIIGIPLWLGLKLLGAMGPNLYVEASLK